LAAFTVAFIRLVLRPFAQDELMTMWKIGRDVGNMFHWNGRLLPVEDLCALAREHDIIPVVDGAQRERTLATIGVGMLPSAK
jgi:hypothetical protein